MKQSRMLKYRVYPSKKQIAKLDYQLRICKEVYNILLDQNQKYGFTKKFDYNQIIASVKVTCKQRYGTVHSQVLQNVSDRASKAFDNFFARIKLRKQGIKVKAGYPRFKRRISSITYPQSGYKLLPNKKLWASTIGNMPIILSRPLQGNVKTLTLKKNKADQWFAVFSCEIDTPIRTHPSAEKVGIDVGLERFGTLSKNRGIIANPRFLRKSEKTLRRLQRTLSRKTLRGNNWQKQRLKVARCHVKIANQRADFLHKTSSALAKSYCHIKCEKLKIQNMLKNHCLAKSISDAGWGAFLRMLSYKELTLGGQLEGVNPAYTSQTCKVCKKRTKHILSERIFACKHCGHSEHRDNNAADNIEDTEGHSEIYTPVDTEPLQQRFVVASLVEETGTTSGASK